MTKNNEDQIWDTFFKSPEFVSHLIKSTHGLGIDESLKVIQIIKKTFKKAGLNHIEQFLKSVQ